MGIGKDAPHREVLPKIRTGVIATQPHEESTHVQTKNHAPAFKAKMAPAALSGEKTIAGLSSEFGVHQTLIYKWVRQLKDSAAGVSSGEAKREKNCTSSMPKSASSPWNAIF